MRYAVAMNGHTGGFEIHAAECRDLAGKTPSRTRRFVAEYTGNPWVVEAASGQAALDAELAEDFDGGSYAAAGFTGRVFPCASEEQR